MRLRKTTGFMVLLIALMASVAAVEGIFSATRSGEYIYTSIRGQDIKIFGGGIYRHMSSDVAIQGIAQDYVTLFAGVPLLILSYFLAIKGSLRWKYLFTGTLGYFLVTYLFYMCMAMYNEFFLVYIALTSLSFYSFVISILSFNLKGLKDCFSEKLPARFSGGFLIFCSIAIALMWLGVVVPPLLKGTVYPEAVSHYTTLIVQAMDLAILLPASFISGFLLIRKNDYGYLLAPVYTVFLSILMTALLAKIIGMSLVGVNAGPALIVIPLFNLTAITSSVLLLKSVKSSLTF